MADPSQVPTGRYEGPGEETRSLLSYLNPLHGFISKSQLLLFTKYFATLTKSGIPVLRSLATLSRQMQVWRFKQMIWDMKTSVEGGLPLHQSVRKNEDTFGQLYSNLIKTGEESGRLYQVLERLTQLLERDIKLRRKVLGALTYPAIVMFVAVAVVAFLMLWVIPQFAKLFANFNTQLPGPTRFVIAVSEFLAGNVLNIVAGTLFLAIVVYQINQTEWGRRFFDGLKLKVPVFGNLITQFNVAQFSRNLAILFRSGVTIINALRIANEAVENVVIAEGLSQVAREVEGGIPVAAALTRMGVMPELSIQMIEVGEEAGNLDDMLEKVADFYEEEINFLIDQMTALIEPAFIVVLGTIVGTIVMAMYLPIFQMAKVVTGGSASQAPTGGVPGF